MIALWLTIGFVVGGLWGFIIGTIKNSTLTLR